MRVSLRWLAEWVDLPGLAELQERLTLAGLEIESVETIGPDLSQMRVGHVVHREKHPQADRLSFCRVDVGEGGEPREIVCGAPNVAAGQKVVVALPGSTLPDGTVLKRTKIRGVVSDGMICSSRELGLGDDHDGILVLDAATPIGVPFSQVWQTGDTVLDLEITPNRGDWASMLGIAREVRANFGGPLRLPSTAVVESQTPTEAQIRVSIEDGQGCARYVARVVRGVDPTRPSPEWLKTKLEAAGVRSLSVIVDVTNLVMLELGQPLHAFDLGTLRGAEIRVRSALAGEKLATLDGQVRELVAGDLVIADAERAVALAGVMGGSETEVGDGTRDVLIESAQFSPARIRRTSRRVGLHSEASYRFERGVDPEGVTRAADRAAALIAELAGGEICAGRADARGDTPVRVESISLDPAHPNRLLGTALTTEQVVELLARVDVTSTLEAGRLRCVVPSHRPDLRIPQDLIEEVGRLHGYDQIQPTLPRAVISSTRTAPGRSLEERTRDALAAAGLIELVHFPATCEADLTALQLRLAEPPLALVNPMNDREALMRPSLLPALLRSVQRNRARGVDALRVFEVGPVFQRSPAPELPRQPLHAAAVITRGELKHLWDPNERPPIFYEIRGVAERLLADLEVSADFSVGEATFLHPGATLGVSLGKTLLGVVGELHPSVASAFEIEVPCAVLELDLSPLLGRVRTVPTVQAPSRYPAVRRDVAVLLDRAQPAAEIASAIRSAGGASLVHVELFDRFIGTGVPTDKVSLAFRLIFQLPDRTLTDGEVSKAVDKVRNMLVRRFGGELR